jgi:hypothetical protein
MDAPLSSPGFRRTSARANPSGPEARHMLHNLLKFQGFNASYGVDTHRIALFVDTVETGAAQSYFHR